MQKKIQDLQKDLERKRGDQQKQAKDMESFERLLQDVTAQLQALNEESHEGGVKLQMAESQVREYRKMLVRSYTISTFLRCCHLTKWHAVAQSAFSKVQIIIVPALWKV